MGSTPGPTLIVVGAVHGNEPAGVLGLQRFFQHVEATGMKLAHGQIVAFTGNRKALAVRKRFLDQDLNRHWAPERVERLRGTRDPLSGEDEELRELDVEISAVCRDAHPNYPVFLLDIHTTSGTGGAFANLEDSLPNRDFAFALPVPVVLGLEEELSGTLTSYWNGEGLITTGFEAGQHDEPEAVERANAAVWIALTATGLLDEDCEEVQAAQRRLDEEHRHLPHVLEVRYRHAIRPEDAFAMDPGYVNFEPVEAAQPLATDHRGRVMAPQAGRILMPLYQKLGADGFFIVRRVHRRWLELSAVLRRLRLERFLHWLPGVRRHPEGGGRFIADRRFARWLALELFHLLGFRRDGEADSRFLVMSRRRYDLEPVRGPRPGRSGASRGS